MKRVDIMKDISFVVPCFNSQDYMEHCIDSLLLGKDQVEIIIIDDGSTDNTGKIADRYQKKYPKTIKVVHQKNGGHGAGIMAGLKMATGRYFKVVDSDDWADKKSYKTLLRRIKKIDADVIIMNYVYTFNDGRKDQVINFSNVFKDNETIRWDEIKRFKISQYLSLHSMMYKKSILDKTKIDLPKHTFYEDNLFIYLPMINTETIHYMNLNFYRYFIGRADQSVQQEQLIKKSHHQVEVSKRVCIAYDLDIVKNKKLKKVMYRECVLLIVLGSCFSRLKKDREGEEQFLDLWNTVKKRNPKLYKKLRRPNSIAFFVSIKGPIGRFITRYGFKLAHSIVHFN